MGKAPGGKYRSCTSLRNEYLSGMNAVTGKWLMAAGLLLLVAGLIIFFFHDKMNWLGKLPGDIRIEKKHVRIYFPVTTILLLGVFVSLILYLIRWLRS